MVASFTDAWIETRITYQSTPGCWSHLLQMRGLKLRFKALATLSRTSHLLQMRGLKPLSLKFMIKRMKSHLLQMRGLKLNILAKISDLHSRIFYRCVD